MGTHKLPNAAASPEQGRLPTGITAVTVLVFGFSRLTLSFGLFEIQTSSSAAIQSGEPGTAKTASGCSRSIGILTPGVLTPGFGGDGVCTDSYTNATKGGIPASLYPLTECTVATLDLTAYPGGKDFLAAYKAKYGVSNPDPYAIYGYEAMKLGLDTIKKLGANGDNKADVLKALFATTGRSSVLGTYGFNKNGDTTLKSYGLYKVGSNGEPVFVKTLTPTQTVG